MQRLTALKEVRYAGVQRFPGDEFEASDKDARLLMAVKRAAPVEVKDVPARQKRADVGTKEIQPAPLPEAGRYRRRDMQADSGRIGGTALPSSSQVGQAPEPQTSEASEMPKRPGGWRSRKT